VAGYILVRLEACLETFLMSSGNSFQSPATRALSRAAIYRCALS
jgi:hypothetical protein